MTQLTAAQAQEHLDAWTAADLALASAGSYTIGNRQLTRVNAQEVRNHITYWQRAVRTLTASESGQVNEGGFRVATWT